MVATEAAYNQKESSLMAQPFLHNVLSSDDIEELVRRNEKKLNKKAEEAEPSDADSTVVASSWMCSLGNLLNVEDEIENTLSLCSRPFKSPDVRLETAPTRSRRSFQLDEHNSTGLIDDADSIASLSTLGRGAFGDLNSIPSVADSRFKILDNKHAENEIDDTSTIGSIGGLSVLSLPMKNDDETLVTVDLSVGGNDHGINLFHDEIEITNQSTQQDEIEFVTNLGRISAISNKLLSKTPTQEDGTTATRKSKPESWDGLKSLRNDLIRDLRKAVNSYGRYDIRCANIAASIAEVLVQSREYDHALKMRQEAFIIYRSKLGDHHVTTVDAKVQMGKAKEIAGDYDGALELFFGVLSMRRAVLGRHDSSIPEALVLIAGALKRKGRATQAIREMKRALKLFRECLGDAHHFVTDSVEEIASLYVTVGDYQKAAMINEELVKLRAATDGTNTEGVGRTLLELATAYEAAGENVKGMKALKKSYAVFTAMGGENSIEAAGALERIAQNYSASKKPDNAVTAYLGVLRSRKQFLGESDPMVADTYLNLGIALRDNTQYDKAMKCMKQALSIFVGEGRNMDDVGMIAEVMHEMAMTHRCKGQLEETKKLLKQELTIRQKMGSRELPAVAKALHHLGSTELTLMNNTQALNFFMEALSVYEKLDSGLGVDFAETLHCTGLVFEATRHVDRAKEAFTEALRIFRAKGLPETSDQIQKVKWKLNRYETSKPNVESTPDTRQTQIRQEMPFSPQGRQPHAV